jgi:hypothetical protein
MPNLQSFGHARNTLLLPEYQHLAESEMLWTLSPAYEETYSLLDELYGDMLPAFSSTTLNVNCDETYDLGLGASKELVERSGVGQVYLEHILRVRALAARYGRRIQIWGDILLNHPELIDEVPDDITLLDWQYGPADAYPNTQTFGEAGRRFWVCPGTGSWNSIYPRVDGARINIRNLVRDGVAAGAEGVLNTDWGDHGHYQPLGLSWHGYVLGAVQGWTGGMTGDKEFDRGFGPLFFGQEQEAIMEALHKLAHTNDLAGVHTLNRSQTVMALFDEPLAGETVSGDDALPAETLEQLVHLAEAAGTALGGVTERVPNHPRKQTLREMAFAAHLTSYAARKTALGQGIRAGLREIAACPEPAAQEAEEIHGYISALKDLEAELEGLRAEFAALWLARARRSEIHVALGYYASLRTRYQAAMAWLEEQRLAALAGQQVDAELGTYERGNHRVLWQTWPD